MVALRCKIEALGEKKINIILCAWELYNIYNRGSTRIAKQRDEWALQVARRGLPKRSSRNDEEEEFLRFLVLLYSDAR